MSNIKINNQAIEAIKKAWSSKLGAEDTFARHMDTAKQYMRWTDAVSPTKNNLASGKSTASVDAYKQLKELFETILKGKKRAHSSTAIGAEIVDLKNALMRRQDPKLYALTDGKLKDIVNVSVDGKVTMKEKVEQTPVEKAENMVKSLKSFLEKNQTELGDNYKTMHRATLQMMADCKIKI
jgi:hypothetical protein